MTEISFEQLIEKKKFNTLKLNFLKNDFCYKYSLENNEDVKIDLTQNDITVYQEITVNPCKDLDEFGIPKFPDEIEIVEKNLNFYKDWLIPEISKLYNKYMDLVIVEIGKIEAYGTVVVNQFCNKTINKLNKYEDKIKNVKHLNTLVKKEAIGVIQKLNKSINYDFYKRKASVPDKIRLKLSKSQVCVFFQLLLNNNVITGSHPNDLFRFVENNFYYYNSSKNIYLDIEDAKITSDNLISKKSNKSAEATLKKLQKIFCKSNFFQNAYD